MAIPKEILRKVRRIEIRTRRIVNDVFAGSYHSAFKGQGMEFAEVREYQPGDDIRSIDWNVTARMDTPFIKQFTEERELTIWLLVDISASQRFGSARLKQDVVAEIAAILAFAATKNQDRIGLILFSDEVELHVAPRKGLRHVLRVVSDVLNHRPVGHRTDLRPALDLLNKVNKRKSVVFLLSDFQFGTGWERTLAITARHHDLIAVAVADRHEFDWPKVGLVEWEDQETGERVLVDTSDKRTRRELEHRFSARRKALLDQLARNNVDTVEINAHEPYDTALFRFFRKRAMRLKSA